MFHINNFHVCWYHQQHYLSLILPKLLTLITLYIYSSGIYEYFNQNLSIHDKNIQHMLCVCIYIYRVLYDGVIFFY